MVTSNRQINTKHSPAQSILTLEVLKECTLGGRKMVVGEKFQASKSEAKRLLMLDKKMFKVLLD